MTCIHPLLLWCLVVIGAWNLLNAIARKFYDEPGVFRYSVSIVFGAWAAALLLTTDGGQCGQPHTPSYTRAQASARIGSLLPYRRTDRTPVGRSIKDTLWTGVPCS